MSTSTSTLDSLVADFKLRLDKIDRSSLQQWQFAYKEVILAMGLKILEQFPRNALGPKPTEEERIGGGGQPGGGQSPGLPGPTTPTSPIKRPGPAAPAGWPGSGLGPIIHAALAALELDPPPPP